MHGPNHEKDRLHLEKYLFLKNQQLKCSFIGHKHHCGTNTKIVQIMVPVNMWSMTLAGVQS